MTDSFFITTMIVYHNNAPQKGVLGTYFTASTIYKIDDNGEELVLHCSDGTTNKLTGDWRTIALKKLRQTKEVLKDI